MTFVAACTILSYFPTALHTLYSVDSATSLTFYDVDPQGTKGKKDECVRGNKGKPNKKSSLLLAGDTKSKDENAAKWRGN